MFYVSKGNLVNWFKSNESSTHVLDWSNNNALLAIQL